jgi:hypothetical protein
MEFLLEERRTIGWQAWNKIIQDKWNPQQIVRNVPQVLTQAFAWVPLLLPDEMPNERQKAEREALGAPDAQENPPTGGGE